MNFSAKEDIKAPIDYVFERVTDFPSFERSALRRGVDVQRMDNRSTTGVGMAWDITFKLRGKRREMKMELTSLDSPNSMVLTSLSNAMGGDLIVDLVALSRNRTRLNAALKLKPTSLSARLLVQSFKLMRSNLNQRYRHRIADFARDIEDRYNRTT